MHFDSLLIFQYWGSSLKGMALKINTHWCKFSDLVWPRYKTAIALETTIFQREPRRSVEEIADPPNKISQVSPFHWQVENFRNQQITWEEDIRSSLFFKKNKFSSAGFLFWSGSRDQRRYDWFRLTHLVEVNLERTLKKQKRIWFSRMLATRVGYTYKQSGCMPRQ